MNSLELIADWAWARHHNEWSWYIRPLIIIGFCMAAWFRKPVIIFMLAIFFPISAVIFPAPQNPKSYVVEFLQAERNMLEALSPLEMVGFGVLVVVFLFLLATALWQRSFWLGVLIANLGGAIKLIFGYFVWGEVGAIALWPTIVTAIVFNLAMFVFWHSTRTKSQLVPPERHPKR